MSRVRIPTKSRIPAWQDWLDLAGPIFRKESRLTSRKRRFYLLRSVYVLLMAGVVAIAWLDAVPSRAGSINRMARMSEFGLQMVTTIGVFQFIALQLVAPALTGATIFEEFRKQTLPALMTTPISNLQIVTGKFLSKMMLVVLLLATSFPLFAILRLFGGVEWKLILALEGLTLTSALFAAAMSLKISTFCNKQAQDGSALTYLILAFMYFFVPVILSAACGAFEIYMGPAEPFFAYFNPFYSMILLIKDAFRPGSVQFIGLSSPLIQCSLLLAGTVYLIHSAARSIRQSGKKMVEGNLPSESRSKRIKKTVRIHYAIESVSTLLASPRSYFAAFLSDRPVLWRELRRNLWSPGLLKGVGGVCVFLLLLSYYYFWETLMEEPGGK